MGPAKRSLSLALQLSGNSMAQQQAAATTRSLGLLHRLYSGKIQTLHDLLLGMMAGATAPLLAAQQQDKALKKLLSETLAVISDGAPGLPSDLSGRQHSTQPDVGGELPSQQQIMYCYHHFRHAACCRWLIRLWRLCCGRDTPPIYCAWGFAR